MDSPARRLILPFLLAASMAHVAFGQTPARDSLGAARDLYASARYDEALAVLNDMRPADAGAASDLKSIEQYRSLCLLALGRGSEAETAIAAVIKETGAAGPKEMGKVMGALKQRYAGQMDFGKASGLVKELLK